MIDWILGRDKKKKEAYSGSNLEALDKLTERLNDRDESIKKAKQQWETTFDAVPDLIAIIDKDFKIIRTNKALSNRLGRDVKELVGKSCYEILHCSEEPVCNCPHVKTIKDAKIHSIEEHSNILNGYFIITTSPLLDGEEIIGTIHVMKDITERRKYEKRIDRATKFFQKLVNELPCYVAVLDTGGNVVFLDEKWRECTEDFLGCGVDVGENFIEYLKELKFSESVPVIAGLHDIFEGHAKEYREEYKYVRNDEWFCIYSIKFSVQDKNYVLVCQQNTTERVMAELLKREECRFIDSLIDALDRYIIISDANGKILKINKKCEEDFEIDKQYLLGLSLKDLSSSGVMNCDTFNLKNKDIIWFKTTFSSLCKDYTLCVGKES